MFIDHTSRCTSYIDPRLPYPGNELTPSDSEQAGVVVCTEAISIPHSHSATACFSVQMRSRPYLSADAPLRAHTDPTPEPRPRVFSHFSRPDSHAGTEREARPGSFSTLPSYTTWGGGGGAEGSTEGGAGGAGGGGYSERVVQFLQQPDIMEQLESRTGEAVSSTIRCVYV